MIEDRHGSPAKESLPLLQHKQEEPGDVFLQGQAGRMEGCTACQAAKTASSRQLYSCLSQSEQLMTKYSEYIT